MTARRAIPVVLAALALSGCGGTREYIAGDAWGGAPVNAPPNMYYPRAALEAQVSGVVIVGCRVGPRQRLVECAPLYERPLGHGFGDAALAMQAEVDVPSHLPVGQRTVVGIPFCVDEPSCDAVRIEGDQARRRIIAQMNARGDAP